MFLFRIEITAISSSKLSILLTWINKKRNFKEKFVYCNQRDSFESISSKKINLFLIFSVLYNQLKLIF